MPNNMEEDWDNLTLNLNSLTVTSKIELKRDHYTIYYCSMKSLEITDFNLCDKLLFAKAPTVKNTIKQ